MDRNLNGFSSVLNLLELVNIDLPSSKGKKMYDNSLDYLILNFLREF